MLPDSLDEFIPVTRKGFKWHCNDRSFWFKRNAENWQFKSMIFNLDPNNYAYHVKKGTKGY